MFSALLILCTLLFFRANAEQLPVKTYTIADGLARDQVNRVRQDSHGFIWFSTSEGLSRFDGYGFTNYGTEQGLPHRIVNDFLQTRDGFYLVATNGGLVEFNPIKSDANQQTFTPIQLDQNVSVKVIKLFLENPSGAVLVGTENGVYRLMKSASGWQSTYIEIALLKESGDKFVGAMAFDDKGSLWIGTASGLYRLLPDGRSEKYTAKDGLAQDGISELFLDHQKRFWVGTGNGLSLLVKDPKPNEKIVERNFRTKDGLLNNFITALYQSSDGRFWIGTRSGLNLMVQSIENETVMFRGFTTTQGLRSINVWDVNEDNNGNIWLTAENGGVTKIARAGFVSYFENDMHNEGRISQIFSDRLDNIYVLSNTPQNMVPVFSRFNGQGFVESNPALPSNVELTWGWNQLVVQDKNKDWWIGTSQGIFHFAGGDTFENTTRKQAKKVYTIKDGLNDNQIFRLFEDSHGDMWFCTLGHAGRALHHLKRSTDKIHIYTPERDGIPYSGPTAFANDEAENLWIGFYGGGVARYKDGRFQVFTENDGLPKGFVRHLYFDSKKRLWIATSYGGVARVDNPSAEKLSFVKYTTGEGLASNQVTSVVEDNFGRIYLGTGRGLDRLDPETNQIKHFTIADGLADNFINTSFRSSKGELWFGTLRGLSKLLPDRDEPRSAPSIIISGLHVAGVKQPISELGQTEVTMPDLSYMQNQLQIDFLSISYASGDVLRYQFKFEDSNSDWSAFSEQRAITLPNLPPGTYRFLVRAINSDGVVSTQPASVAFRIMPPIWKRWWFIALCLIVVGLIGFAFIRSRLQTIKALQQAREERLRELEKVRTRIATDLHDDIGASLTQIAVLSEVAQQTSNGNANGNGNGNGSGDGKRNIEPLVKISRVSNELVETMSDIVWAINPHKDHLSDLAQRMRRFASDVFSAKEIVFRFHAPEMKNDTHLGANIRREVFLIYKESVNNIVKHSKCSEAEVEFKIEDGFLLLSLRDNGCGFEYVSSNAKGFMSNGSSKGGNGLSSMTHRARELGGEYLIESRPTQGTSVTLRVPLSVKEGMQLK